MQSTLDTRKRPYQRFLEDLRKLLQREKEANLTTLRIKHQIGTRLLEEKEQLKYGDIFEFLKKVAHDLHYSWGELYRCARFAEKFPDFQGFLNREFTIQAKNEGDPGAFVSVHTNPCNLRWSLPV